MLANKSSSKPLIIRCCRELRSFTVSDNMQGTAHRQNHMALKSIVSVPMSRILVDVQLSSVLPSTSILHTEQR